MQKPQKSMPTKITSEPLEKEQLDRICQKMTKLLIKKQKLKATEAIQIIPGLYLGNYANALSLSKKQNQSEFAQKIGLVISCVKIDERDRCDKIDYEFVPVKDKPEENISQYFENVFNTIKRFIQKNNDFQNFEDDGDKNERKSILINCFSGKSRSSTLMISYLMKKNGMSFQEGYEFVKEKAPQIEPNQGFFGQLCEYGEKIEYQKNKIAENRVKVNEEDTNLLDLSHKQGQKCEEKPQQVLKQEEYKNTNLLDLSTSYNERKDDLVHKQEPQIEINQQKEQDLLEFSQNNDKENDLKNQQIKNQGEDFTNLILSQVKKAEKDQGLKLQENMKNQNEKEEVDYDLLENKDQDGIDLEKNKTQNHLQHQKLETNEEIQKQIVKNQDILKIQQIDEQKNIQSEKMEDEEVKTVQLQSEQNTKQQTQNEEIKKQNEDLMKKQDPENQPLQVKQQENNQKIQQSQVKPTEQPNEKTEQSIRKQESTLDGPKKENEDEDGAEVETHEHQGGLKKKKKNKKKNKKR